MDFRISLCYSSPRTFSTARRVYSPRTSQNNSQLTQSCRTCARVTGRATASRDNLANQAWARRSVDGLSAACIKNFVLFCVPIVKPLRYNSGRTNRRRKRTPPEKSGILSTFPSDGFWSGACSHRRPQFLEIPFPFAVIQKYLRQRADCRQTEQQPIGDTTYGTPPPPVFQNFKSCAHHNSATRQRPPSSTRR